MKEAAEEKRLADVIPRPQLNECRRHGILLYCTCCPLPRSVRDTLLAEGRAQEHRWVPNSGWITSQVRGEEDLKHAMWLMRLSHLRYALKTADDPRRYLDEQTEDLQLDPHLKSLFEALVPKIGSGVAPIPAAR